MLAVYVRVSSKNQDTRSQERELLACTKSQNEEIRWYRDKQTGIVLERPGLDKLLGDVRSKKTTKVVVWRLDRLGRTARGLLELLEEFRKLGVGFFEPPRGV